ncbi:phytanoyl-CoA dioxygenase family protein [Chloroflexi bacterium TSY]|nr:phytanoyl-CoA dioxygenase family protein [Chloroflexi bacterium TSY]
MKPLDVHFTEYQRDGYTIFKQYLMPDRLTALRRQLDPIMEQRFKELPDLPRAVIPEALTHEMLGPLLIEQILNPVLLDFAELVMGPYVQLDSYRIAGFPIKPAPLHNQVDRWHRDAFNLTETWVNYAFRYEPKPRPYTAPMACNCLTYLQDMTETTGALRVIPGSHLDYTFIAPEDAQNHTPRKADHASGWRYGFTHCEMLHSGSVNTSSEFRYFISIYLQRFGLPHRDNFEVPAIAQILAQANKDGDRRVMRLFGQDDSIQHRQQRAWQQMIAEERTG